MDEGRSFAAFTRTKDEKAKGKKAERLKDFPS